MSRIHGSGRTPVSRLVPVLGRFRGERLGTQFRSLRDQVVALLDAGPGAHLVEQSAGVAERLDGGEGVLLGRQQVGHVGGETGEQIGVVEGVGGTGERGQRARTTRGRGRWGCWRSRRAAPLRRRCRRWRAARAQHPGPHGARLDQGAPKRALANPTAAPALPLHSPTPGAIMHVNDPVFTVFRFLVDAASFVSGTIVSLPAAQLILSTPTYHLRLPLKAVATTVPHFVRSVAAGADGVSTTRATATRVRKAASGAARRGIRVPFRWR